MEVPELSPLTPCRSYDLHNPEAPRQTGMSERELPKWFAQALALDNPVMRELWVMAALTGLRRRDACTMRWQHVNLKEAYVQIPTPKGGAASTFPCPLTPPLR